MPWTASGEEWPDPWLPLVDTSRNVETQRGDPGSILSYTRRLIELRESFADGSYETLPSAPGIWAYRRGDLVCVLNLTDEVAAHGGNSLQPWEGAILDASSRRLERIR